MTSRLRPVTRYCWLLLPTIVLLFTGCGMPVAGSAAKLPMSVTVTSDPNQPSPPETAQAASSATATPDHRALPASADAANGQQLFNTFQPAAGIACSTCHRVDSEERLVGPGLMNVGKRAQTRIQGLNALEYLHQSIVSPSAYVVAGYSDLMPKNWGQVFSEKQIDDLIAYLLTLASN